ncbi:MAG: SpoIIE family protein phosphatase [Pyrinomonadaceae bacterium]
MKSRYAYYIPLVALFVVATAYHLSSSVDIVRVLLYSTEQARAPFELQEVSAVIAEVQPEAEGAGLHTGDRLLSVDGQTYRGSAALDESLDKARPGDTLTVVVRHAETEGAAEQTSTIPLAALRTSPHDIGEWVIRIVLLLLMPLFCLALGFWVAALRPRDPLAWLLLGLMLSFALFASPKGTVGSGWLRDAGLVYKSFFTSSWSLWMMLFGIYFPERLSLDKRWPWAKWLFIIPIGCGVISSIVLNVGAARDFARVAAFRALLLPYQTILLTISMLAVSTFFAALGYKWGKTFAPDARRRLRLLLIGTQISLAPTLLLIVASLALGAKRPMEGMPAWLTVPALLLLFLFPLTLAYVIVVNRAMDVRVVIRQGVQYALAKSGVRVIQVALSAIIIFAAASFISSSSTNRPQKIIVISAGITFVFLLQGLAERLRRWTDRRFFREAYNAEVILSDLSEKVRTMVETAPLLETVAQRISESLHIPRIALLLKDDGTYRPAYALGYSDTPPVSFTERSATVNQLRRSNEPLLIYSDDKDSWVNKTAGGDGERAMLAQLETQLLLPLSVKEKLPGFISLGAKQSEEPYSSMDLRLLQSVATQTGLALENSQLTAAIASEVAQRERLNREVEIAREVQERLFPQECLPVPGLDYAGACRPALGVGGDYYDFLLLPNDKLGIAIGDVSGKGISAALLMASLQASLRGQAMQGTNDLAQLMGHVNRLVYDASAENRYATFFYAQYDPSTRDLTYVNAGHNPPMIFRQVNGACEVTRLEIGGVVVGLLRDFPYSQGSVRLEPGDLFVAFTDGISEAMNPAEEEWGEDQLTQAVQSYDDRLTAAEMITRLVNAADAFAAGAKQHDDMTAVVVKAVDSRQ